MIVDSVDNVDRDRKSLNSRGLRCPQILSTFVHIRTAVDSNTQRMWTAEIE
jgi:hypothetical protein